MCVQKLEAIHNAIFLPHILACITFDLDDIIQKGVIKSAGFVKTLPFSDFDTGHHKTVPVSRI